MEGTQPKHKNIAEEGLTPIPLRIHCAATQDGVGGPSQADEIMVNTFIATLAEVAIAVAKRRIARIRRVK